MDNQFQSSTNIIMELLNDGLLNHVWLETSMLPLVLRQLPLVFHSDDLSSDAATKDSPPSPRTGCAWAHRNVDPRYIKWKHNGAKKVT